MRPYVPPPTTRKNRPAQIVVMVTPIGEISMDCPGTTKGAADWTADEAAAAALGSTLVGPLAEVENTPLTKDASPEESVVSTSWPVTGLRAARSIWGIRSGLRESLTKD